MTSLVLCDASTLYLTVVIPYARDTIANAAFNANIVEGATSCTRPCGPMDKASVYGTGDSRFESWQGQFYLSSLRTRSMKENTITTRGARCESYRRKWSHAGSNRGPYGY